MANPFACTYRPDYPPSEEDWLRSMKTIRSFNIEPYPAPAAFYALQQHQKHSHTEDSPQGLPEHTVCVECTVKACHCDLVVACRLCRALSHPVCLQGRLLKQIRAGKRPQCKICTLPFGIQFMINYIGSNSMVQCPSIRQEQEEARRRRAEDFVDAIVEVIHAGMFTHLLARLRLLTNWQGKKK